MDLLAIILLLLSGLTIASIAMAIGIGGGILWVPLLILGFGLPTSDAITVSLLIQVFGLASGSLAYIRAGLVEPQLSWRILAVALPGVILGTLFSLSLPQQLIQLALGVLAMTLALLFVSTQEGRETHGSGAGFDRSRCNAILPVPAFFGLVMGFLSTGIGEWLIPLLKGRLHMEMRRAIATVIPVMFLLALVASGLRVLMAVAIPWEYVIWGGLGTLVGGQIGAKINQHIADRLLKEGFIYLMTLIGIHLIFQAV